MSKLKVYLAGAIRSDHPEDFEWRQKAIEILSPVAIILNPLAGKWTTDDDFKWRMSGLPTYSKTIVRSDMFFVQSCDAMIANVKSLDDNYPSIGTMFEIGYGRALGKLIYGIVGGDQKHCTGGKYQVHPFIDDSCAAIFDNVDNCLQFARLQLEVHSGQNPHYGRHKDAIYL